MSACGGDGNGTLADLLRAGEVALPSLWETEGLRADEGALPSFAELWKDLGGVYESDKGPFEGLEGGAAGWDGLDAAGTGENAGCSSMYAEEVFDGGCGDQCTCSSTCGCRGGIGGEEGGADGPPESDGGLDSSG